MSSDKHMCSLSHSLNRVNQDQRSLNRMYAFTITAPDKASFSKQKNNIYIFSYFSIKTYVVGTH